MQVPLIALAIISVALFLNLPKLPDGDLKEKFKRVDVLGAATLIISIFTLLFALDRGGNVAWRDRFTIASLIVAFVTCLLFIITEFWIAREPLAPRHILTDPALMTISGFSFLTNVVFMCVVYVVSLYLQVVGGMNAGQAGLAIGPTIFSAVAGSLASGLLIQSTGKYYWLTVCMSGTALLGSIIVASATGAWIRSNVGAIIGQCRFVIAFCLRD